MRPRRLASQVLLIQIAIVAATVLASGLISFVLVSAQVTDEYEKRALAIGHSVALMPDVVEAFDHNGFRIRSVHRQFVLPIAFHKTIGSRRFTLWSEELLDRAGLLKLFGSPVTLVAERCASS